jgi:hypothetical protein
MAVWRSKLGQGEADETGVQNREVRRMPEENDRCAKSINALRPLLSPNDRRASANKAFLRDEAILMFDKHLVSFAARGLTLSKNGTKFAE